MPKPVTNNRPVRSSRTRSFKGVIAFALNLAQFIKKNKAAGRDGRFSLSLSVAGNGIKHVNGLINASEDMASLLARKKIKSILIENRPLTYSNNLSLVTEAIYINDPKQIEDLLVDKLEEALTGFFRKVARTSPRKLKEHGVEVKKDPKEVEVGIKGRLEDTLLRITLIDYY